MPSPPALRSVTGTAQGTTYSLQWIGGADEASVAQAAELELERLDALLSNYREDSVLERFNAARTTEPIEVPTELVALLEIANDVHAASGGCFDPTVRPLVRAWGFDGDTPEIPSDPTLADARARVGFEKLSIVDATHLRKVVPGVEIDMASLGQGYTAERLASLLEGRGSSAYLAEIGGEIVARGVKADGTRWRVGVEDPGDAGGAGPTLHIPNDGRAAVITSGSYRQYLTAGSRRLGHVFDPRSGEPVEHSLLSATVVGHDAATAAAWATALLCLGPAEATAFAERNGVAALLWMAGAAAPVATSALDNEWRALLVADDAP
ncbi:MAG TPA: FAD:protein FMN transferase [Gammaproteobacteria bacterium]|nr:FAD:protein FMN transferase [Gammaproteobacteria bacterium]